MSQYGIRGKRFLITGGAGFIGSNLCDAVIQNGGYVRCLDNLCNGKLSNIQHLMTNPGFEFVEGDIRDFLVCLSACEEIDFVLHQAALASVPESMELPVQYGEVNVQGTVNVMEAARQMGVKRLVYASSAAVYGDNNSLPQREGNEGVTLSPYALSKYCDEIWARQYTKLYGLETVGLRYFNVYGKRQDPNGAYASVIPKFICRLIKGLPVTIYGDGTQTRDFAYIDDVVSANLCACIAEDKAVGSVYNIAGGETISVLDLYRIIVEELAIKDEPNFESERAGDIKHSCADITNARKMLGYMPKGVVRDGIKATINWYRHFLWEAN